MTSPTSNNDTLRSVDFLKALQKLSEANSPQASDYFILLTRQITETLRTLNNGVMPQINGTDLSSMRTITQTELMSVYRTISESFPTRTSTSESGTAPIRKHSLRCSHALRMRTHD